MSDRDNGKRGDSRRRNLLLGGSALSVLGVLGMLPRQARAQQQPAPPATGARKPNILVIFGDDVGIANISTYSGGLMGYETPNIDRIAREGIKFQHYYGEQSCTAGRAAFLTGQHGIRTGLTKVGFPGAPMGMSQLDPSIGGLLKNLGYATGQFGKNHVGDRNETLADGERVRRILRQPLPPQCRGGTGAAGLSQGPGLPRQVRAARRAEMQGERQGRSRRSIRASARSASRPSRTPARSPRSAWRRSMTRPRPQPSIS